MTYRELISRMDSSELAMWEAFYRLEPWGSDKDDLAVAVSTSIIASPWYKKPIDPFSILKVLNPDLNVTDMQTVDDIKTLLSGISTLKLKKEK